MEVVTRPLIRLRAVFWVRCAFRSPVTRCTCGMRGAFLVFAVFFLFSFIVSLFVAGLLVKWAALGFGGRCNDKNGAQSVAAQGVLRLL